MEAVIQFWLPACHPGFSVTFSLDWSAGNQVLFPGGGSILV